MNHDRRLLGMLAIVLALLAASAKAHLMPTGKGTLNVRENAVYMVLALPISAFPRLDGSGDGKVTMEEFEAGRSETIAAIEHGVWLYDGISRRGPEHILLAPEAAHHGGGVGDVSILARFTLTTADAAPTRFAMTLFGPDQDAMIIHASRKAAGMEARMTLRPDDPESEFLWM